jgi:hypothetical protein
MYEPLTESLPTVLGGVSADTMIPLVVAAKAIALALGVVVTHLAVRAARKRDVPGLRRLAVGFGIFTLGVVLGGVVYTLAGNALLPAVLVQSTATALGFGVIAHSLYKQGERVPTETSVGSSG